MSDILENNSLKDDSNVNLNLIKINLENSEDSTNSRIDATENNFTKIKIKYGEMFYEESSNKLTSHGNSKKNTKKNGKKLLNCKTKRSNNKQIIKNKNEKKEQFKSGKYKLIYKIYNEFKNSSPLFREYPQFNYIEKNIKNNLYSSLPDLAREIRNIFSQIFYQNSSDSLKYDKTLSLCNNFEKIYKEYDNQIFLKESKNLHEIINKLKRELRQTEIYKNPYNNISINNNNNYSSYYSNNKIFFNNKNKFKFHLNESFDDNNHISSEMSMQKYKSEISNKISKLSNEQKRGILTIISSNCVLDNKNSESTVMKLDVNKMSIIQLKELGKYVNKCIKDNNNNKNINYLNYNNSNLSLYNNESENLNLNENDIIKNDDLSSCLSDDEDDEEEE